MCLTIKLPSLAPIPLNDQVLCAPCHSFSGHLYADLGDELGSTGGLTMKNDFCEELVAECDGQVTFDTYEEGMSYCYKHTGGGSDRYWSYPYTEGESRCHVPYYCSLVNFRRVC